MYLIICDAYEGGVVTMNKTQVIFSHQTVSYNFEGIHIILLLLLLLLLSLFVFVCVFL
jgi:hypothetical protein